MSMDFTPKIALIPMVLFLNVLITLSVLHMHLKIFCACRMT